MARQKTVGRKVLRLRQLRRAAEMTQAQLAARVHLTTSAINSIETGRTRPSFDKGLQIAKVFGRSAEEVFTYVDVPSREAVAS